MPSTYLPIYLNDHLAGATAGVELARRAAGDDADGPLATLAREIEEDRDALLELMDHLGVEPSRLKPAMAWLAEKAGRLKLNGEVLDESPLSALIELEGLALGVHGKLALWQALERTVADDPRLAGFDLAGLIARAADQRERLEALRLAAAGTALG